MTITPPQSLGELDAGRPATVVRVVGDPARRRRLAALGVRPGAQVSTVQRSSGGGKVIAVAGSRIALDHSVLAQIEVTHD